jgi:hypothetical protein
VEAAGFDFKSFATQLINLANPNNKEGIVYNFDQIAKSIEQKC